MTFFLKIFLALTLSMSHISCNSDAPSPPKNGDTDESTSRPVDITGTYLSCEYTSKKDSETTVGCRLALNESGHKYDLTKNSDIDWGFKPYDGLNISMTKPATSTDPWQVYYKIAGDSDLMLNSGSLVMVGLNSKNNVSTNYQKVDDLIGKLNILMEGRWVTNRCLSYYWTPNTFYTRTDVMVKGKYTTYLYIYDTNSCSGTASFTQTYIGPFTKVVFDGLYFYADVLTDTWKALPLTTSGINALKKFCPNFNFTLNVESTITSCETKLTEYTTMKIDEDNERIYLAKTSQTNNGETPETRKKDLQLDWYLQKQ